MPGLAQALTQVIKGLGEILDDKTTSLSLNLFVYRGLSRICHQLIKVAIGAMVRVQLCLVIDRFVDHIITPPVYHRQAGLDSLGDGSRGGNIEVKMGAIASIKG